MHNQPSFRFHVRAAAALVASTAALWNAPAAVAAELLMPAMVVTASRTPAITGRVGSAVTVIEAEDIERKQVRLLSDVLREVPGVAVNRSGTPGTLTRVRIRGAEGNHTLVRIDGVEVNDPSVSEFDFGNLLAADVERIEVLRGPQSALYGSDAIGGVIDITTKRGEGPARGQWSLEGGSFGTAQLQGRVAGASEGFNYALGITGYTTDGVSIAPQSEGNTEDDGYDNETANVRLGFTPAERVSIDLTARRVDATGETDPQPATAGLIRVVDGDEEMDTLQETARLSARYEGRNVEHILGADYNRHRSDTFSDGALSFESEGERTGFDYQANIFWDTPDFADAEHTLTFLAEREEISQFTRSPFGGSDLKTTNDGYVLEYRLGLNDSVFLSNSVRRDDNELFEDTTTYRSTLAWLIGETGLRLHGSFGTGVKNPTLFELFGFGPTFIPNPELEAEESQGWDIGIEKNFGAGLVDITFFSNRITNLIQGGGNTAVNLPGTSKADGIELTYSHALSDRTRVDASYTYTDTEDADGLELVRRPKHVASVNVSRDFAAGRGTLDVGIDYNGEQEDLAFSDFFADSSRVTLDNYVLVNLAASYRLNDVIEVFGRVENLLDEEYQEVFGYATTGIGAFAGVRGTW